MRRLNPFAFPPETNQRFALLVAATGVLALSVVEVIVNFHAAQTGPTLAELAQNTDTPFEQTAAAAGKEFLVSSAEACVGVLAVAAVCLAAYAIYRMHPARIRRRRHLEP